MLNSFEQCEARSSRGVVIASWAAVAVMAGIIFWMSAKTGIELDEESGIISLVKAWLARVAAAAAGREVDVSLIGHFSEYLVFGALLANALRLHIDLPRAAALAILIASAYGITDEFHQLFVPSRACDPVDWLVDTLAAALGAFLFFVVVALRKKRAKA